MPGAEEHLQIELADQSNNGEIQEITHAIFFNPGF